MATLYIHIGTPKTATTAIQTFCEKNREALKSDGFYFPEFEYKYPDIPKRRNAHFLVGKIPGENGKEEQERVWKECMDHMIRAFDQYPNVLLTDERIWHGTVSKKSTQMSRLKKIAQNHGFEVKLIVYLRRQDEFAISWWNQQIKAAVSRFSCMKWDAQELQKKITLDYYKHLEKLSGVFGRGNVIVRIFDRNCFQGAQKNIQSDFMDALGLELSEKYVMEKPVVNCSLKENALDIKRVLNGLPDFDSQTKKMVNEAIWICSDYSDACKYNMFSPEERREFLQNFEQSNRLVATEYLHRESGTLFSEVQDELPKWTPDNPYMQEDIIRYFGEVTMLQQKKIMELQEMVMDLKKENQRLNRRIDRITEAVKHPFKTVIHIVNK